MLLILSFASGAAALIYETAWFQELELVIGSSAVSLAVLLAAFMGGNCLGSLAFAKARTFRNPLRLYAILELGIGALGISALWWMPLVGRIYTDWAPDSGSFLFRGAVAAICLLAPAVLMGATLPALAGRISAKSLGLLYGANIAGAVAGCLVAGFYLLRLHDVAIATYVAAAINVLAAICAASLATTTDTPNANDRQIASEGAINNAAIYCTIALSGFCALAAETIWTRTLGLLFGASVYTFSIVLAVFLAGLGIGSTIGTIVGRKLEHPQVALAWCQLLAGAAVAWTGYALTAWLPYWPMPMSSAVWQTFGTDLLRATFALLPSTLLWGASFPLALAAAKETAPAQCMARVYAANTLGAIFGALVAGLVLITSIGLQRTEQVLILLSAAAALLLVRSPAVALLGIALYVVPPLPGVLAAHGRFAASWVGKGEIVYLGEGMNSAVAVSRFPNGALTFHVAGKIQASSVPRDMRLQRMLGHLTTLVPNTPRSVLVIGCGAGVTAGAVAIDPAVEHITIAEIEPLVPQAAAAWFGEQNFDVLQNPKVKLRIDDGRHFLLTSREQFDAITADPLDPWVKGAANLYTLEMFQAMKQHLRPGGAVTMYIQLFETNRDAVRSALATFFEVFPHGTIWGNPDDQGRGHDMVLMGQAEAPRINLDGMEARYRPIAESLAAVGMYSPTDLFATYAGRAEDLHDWLKGAPINRDGNLRMQYLAGLGLNSDDAAAIYAELLAQRHYPDGLFTGSPERMNSMRLALLRH